METREVLVHYIQEFYEVTLLNSQKSYEQKIEEANQVAEKWEKTTSATDHENLQKNQESAPSNGSEGSRQCGEHNKEKQTFENYVVDMKTKDGLSVHCHDQAEPWQMPIPQMFSRNTCLDTHSALYRKFEPFNTKI
ncbi:hypothetical protein AV530_004112 [Patagioenas fasciata monilis]|uniref:Uncharacterized protein n=1 Tax=Patagioenas fasciata monilis TaxID=372326 RepID=A0A1V4JR28_PATFA|nr:hypothetical protein AV530_004112 [Patagioenas fasciata monilis]